MSTDGRGATGRGPYAKTAGVRRRIVEACLEVFIESGYRATTMKAVAERAGISQRGLVHHFPDKEELLAAVLEARDRRTRPGHPEMGNARALAKVLRTHFETLAQPGFPELHTVLSGEAISRDHPAHGYYQERYASLRLYIAASFDALRAQGRLRSPIDSGTLAAMVIGLMDGLQLQWLYHPGSVEVERTFELFLQSLGADLGDRDETVPVAPTSAEA